MRTLAFDGRMGASGDMILAALVAAGASPTALESVENELPIRYAVDQTVKNGIDATTVDVYLEDEMTREGGERPDSTSDTTVGVSESDRETVLEPEGNGSNTTGNHDHAEKDETSDDGDGREHAEGSGVTRSYGEVIDIVGAMSLTEAVEQRATSIFERLGQAEATVHGTDLERTHFHEVGTDDAIADVVGSVLLLAELDVDRVVTTPLATGVVKCR